MAELWRTTLRSVNRKIAFSRFSAGDVAKGFDAILINVGEIKVHGFLSATPRSFPKMRAISTLLLNRRYVRERCLPTR